MDEQMRLERLVKETEARLKGLQRRLLFEADVAEKPRLRAEVEDLQIRLFEKKKQLGRLSREPMRLKTTGEKHADSIGLSVPCVEPRVGLESTLAIGPRTKVFINYSHHDREWCNQLRDQLCDLEDDGLVVIWDDCWIKQGARWREEAEQVLAVTKVAVLLVSADYLGMDFILHNELPLLLADAESRGAVVLPVILSPCNHMFSRSPLSRFQAVNSSPLSGQSNEEQDHTFAQLAKLIETKLGVVKT